MEIAADPSSIRIYEEGWQSWSPAGVYQVTAASPRPPDRRSHTMGWRPGRKLPAVGFQGEGILGIAAPGDPTRIWHAPAPDCEVASIRCEATDDRLVVSADGPVVELVVEGALHEALAALGDLLSPGEIRSLPPGWCSWSAYFGDVTESDVLENLEAAERLGLPLEVVQVDDGYEAGIGDWLDDDPRFGSLRRVAESVAAAGKVAGVWTAPFLVGERSDLAAAHPDWLVRGADAGWNWGQRLLVLDVTNPDAAEHLRDVYAALAQRGFGFHKLDFLYAGALAGGRRADTTPLAAYREGLRLVREGAGPGALLVGCGAPLLPSIGLVDALRVGPDVLPEPRGEPPVAEEPALDEAIARTRARAWTHGRLWAADPDSLVARPEIAARESWAGHVMAYGGVVFSGDPLQALDERGLELTRAALRPSSTTPVA